MPVLLRNYEAAATQFQQVLTANTDSFKQESLHALLGLSHLRYQQRDYAQALELANRATARNRERANKEVAAVLGALRGKIYVAMNEPPQARQAFEESSAALESLRTNLASDERGQRLFFHHRLAAYHGALGLQVQAGQPAAALVYAERSKARVMLDVLRNGRVDIHRALTATEREQENKYKETLLGLNRQLTPTEESATRQPEKITALREQLDKARRNYEVCLAAAYAAHPALQTQRSEAGRPRVALARCRYRIARTCRDARQSVSVRHHCRAQQDNRQRAGLSPVPHAR